MQIFLLLCRSLQNINHTFSCPRKLTGFPLYANIVIIMTLSLILGYHSMIIKHLCAETQLLRFPFRKSKSFSCVLRQSNRDDFSGLNWLKILFLNLTKIALIFKCVFPMHIISCNWAWHTTVIRLACVTQLTVHLGMNSCESKVEFTVLS